MTLAEYMRAKDLRDKAMGDLIGLSESQVSRIRRGICVPSRLSIQMIFKITDGAVTPNDLANLQDQSVTVASSVSAIQKAS